MQYFYVFLVGGALCAIGQILIDYTKLTPARILTSYVVAGVILGGLGIYQYLIDFAGAGAAVPLTGFGNLMAQGVRDAVDQYGLIGALMGGFTAGSAGLAAAILFGLLAALVYSVVSEVASLVMNWPAIWSGNLQPAITDLEGFLSGLFAGLPQQVNQTATDGLERLVAWLNEMIPELLSRAF